MEIPVSPQDLDTIVYNVTRDLIEEKAINGKIEGVTEETTQEVLQDVIFVVERYMYYMNEFFDNKRLAQLKPEQVNIDFEKKS